MKEVYFEKTEKMCKYAFAAALLIGFSSPAFARDDGRYADDPLHAWFDQLASGKGMCCSFADGFSVQDVDWDTQDGKYRVRLHGEWIIVPDNAVVTEPNKFGRAVVWPYMDHLLPPESEAFQYRIKNVNEPHERVAKESELRSA